jgi:RecA/RadA recombinase
MAKPKEELSFLKQLIKDIKDENFTLADDGLGSAEFGGYIDTGSYTFNAALSGSLWGGMADNKIIGLAGKRSAGKTFLALGMLKTFLDSDPTNEAILYETEGATTRQMMKDRGIDTTRVGIDEPTTVEEFKNRALKYVQNYLDNKPKTKVLFILDSLGQLSTNKEVRDTLKDEDTRDMTRAQILKAAFRVLTLKLARANIPMIVTAHVYAAMEKYSPDVIGGGSGLEYAASQLVRLSKSKDKDDDKKVTGGIIKIKMEKSRLSKEFTEVKTLIRYDGGLDRYYGLLDFAEQAGLWKRVSAKYYDIEKEVANTKELGPDATKAEKKAMEEVAMAAALIGHEDEIMAEPEKYFNKNFLIRLEPWVNKEFEYGTSIS